MPANSEYWSCNKPVDEGKVEKYTRCKIVCLEGYDFSKGKKWRSSITHEKLMFKINDVIFIAVKEMAIGKPHQM